MMDVRSNYVKSIFNAGTSCAPSPASKATRLLTSSCREDQRTCFQSIRRLSIIAVSRELAVVFWNKASVDATKIEGNPQRHSYYVLKEYMLVVSGLGEKLGIGHSSLGDNVLECFS